MHGVPPVVRLRVLRAPLLNNRNQHPIAVARKEQVPARHSQTFAAGALAPTCARRHTPRASAAERRPGQGRSMTPAESSWRIPPTAVSGRRPAGRLHPGTITTCRRAGSRRRTDGARTFVGVALIVGAQRADHRPTRTRRTLEYRCGEFARAHDSATLPGQVNGRGGGVAGRHEMAPLWHPLAPPNGADDNREQPTNSAPAVKGCHHYRPIFID